MQENNFETIINTWRRLSGEQVTEPTFTSMSGDSPVFPEAQPSHRRKEEESNLLGSDSKHSVAVGSSTPSVSEGPTQLPSFVPLKTDEPAKETEARGGAGDSDDDDKKCNNDRNSKENDSDGNESSDKDYLEHNDNDDDNDKKPDKDNKSDKKKSNKDNDKVDSVYLRPPPAHKTRSSASGQEDDDCCIKCLYYTLQCCDCVLM